ncbi:MAPK/MAK/MRK overlapping kinase isoform X4 [Dipodomys merriami]|uniref:MAPK/MAK/MRK overlapping kinase isoform X4 n=1 Tax=Dipodomys merriami TaxID=94247 RepID=UPI0038557B9A
MEYQLSKQEALSSNPDYKAIGKIGEGTFSEVMKMQSLRDGNYYACKQMKQHFDSIDQVNSLREIQALRRLNPHPNILTLYEVVFDRKSGSLALICELMDMNIYELIRGRRHPLSERRIMHYMYQLCKSLDHMHRNGIFHRDVKPENILIKQDVLKLGDFGSCRSVYSKQPYTEYISTRWYRAPECLLTDGFYTYKMDLWSAGCVFYEIASLQPLFPGDNELDQISKIHDVIGTPAQRTLTKFKQDREYLHRPPTCPRTASPSCTPWWSTTPTTGLLPTRPCSTPTSRSRGEPKPGLWSAIGEPSSRRGPRRPSRWVTAGTRERRGSSSSPRGLRRTTPGEPRPTARWSCPGCGSRR